MIDIVVPESISKVAITYHKNIEIAYENISRWGLILVFFELSGIGIGIKDLTGM